MDFFEHQELARRTSKRLVWLYVSAVFGVVLSIHAIAVALLLLTESELGTDFRTLFLNPEVMLWTGGLTGLIITAGTLLKIHAIRGGGPKVAETVGGREIAPDTHDFAERRLLNVVEEMALAAGVRVPHVYVLDNEGGINAFAAGYSPDDAAVAVTSGLLRTLNREELQAVVGHEFSHILNGDMRLNIRLIGVLGGILGLAVVGRVVMEIAGRSLRLSSGRRSSSKKNDGAGAALAFLLLGIALWIVGWVGVFFGRLIQSAVSRHREYLADASAAQFTRNPEGLANALKLIGANAEHGSLHNGHASEVSHMLFASGGASLFATHPPILDRIRKLDPAFDGDFASVRTLLKRRAETREPKRADEELPDADLLAAAAVARSALRSDLHRDSPSAQFRNAAFPAVLAWMREDERGALRNSDSAECCLYASILSTEASVRERQMAAVRARSEFGAEFATTTEGWHQRHANWTPRQRRMACELAAETLRAETPATRAAIVRRLDVLGNADGSLDSFEFALGRMVRRRLQTDADSAASHSRTITPASLASEASLTLSALARFGSRSPGDAAAAWEAGARLLSLFGSLPPVATEGVSLSEFEAASGRLVHLPPLAKREFMAACEAVVRHDGEITETEENYLVAVADAIDAVGWTLNASASARLQRHPTPLETIDKRDGNR